MDEEVAEAAFEAELKYSKYNEISEEEYQQNLLREKQLLEFESKQEDLDSKERMEADYKRKKDEEQKYDSILYQLQ